MPRVNIGTNDDGSPRYHYDEPDGHVVYVGRAINGSVEVDGQTVDLSEDFVIADDEAHAAAIADAVGQYLAENGHPTDPNYTYVAPEEA